MEKHEIDGLFISSHRGHPDRRSDLSHGEIAHGQDIVAGQDFHFLFAPGKAVLDVRNTGNLLQSLLHPFTDEDQTIDTLALDAQIHVLTQRRAGTVLPEPV